MVDFDNVYIVHDKHRNCYKALPVPGDGNCIFHAISYFLYIIQI